VSLLDDAREIAATALSRGDGCRICEPWYQEDHRTGCPYGLLPKIVAALEILEEISNGGEIPDASLARRALEAKP